MIEAEGLGKVYWDGDRDLEVLRDVSFSVERGEGAAILGPSGSGKTTLLNLLSGLDRPTSGRVRLDGVCLSELNERGVAELRNKRIGFVFQSYHLLSEFSALENVMLPALMGRKDKGSARERASYLLERVGLKDRMKHFPSELSGGEQQRTAIARSLVNDPAFLFCDEPTGNLDIQMGFEIAELLGELFVKEKKTVLIVTHDERIAKMADRVWNLVEKRWL
ncbi:MAG: ABC transporter ATP-binding protein [Candidatus Omnitrophica bacterium]|nr:ABC transporter ATP-binding protein [Candidatus Omnitrophota bacterium]